MQLEPGPIMQVEYEYKIYRVFYVDGDLMVDYTERELNKLAADGWTVKIKLSAGTLLLERGKVTYGNTPRPDQGSIPNQHDPAVARVAGGKW